MFYFLNVLTVYSNQVLAIAPAAETFHFAETILQELALLIKVILEFIAILVIVIALIVALKKLLRKPITLLSSQSIRLDLGHSLALALEFLLAADIVGTAVSPDWTAIAKLAAITGIRTFLNFFLQREVQELQKNPNLYPRSTLES